MVFSYLLGDNFLYRLAIYIFVGLSAGYIALVTVESVVLPWLNNTLMSSGADVGSRALGLVPFIIGLLLFLKTSPRLGRLGNLGIAFLIAVGTAVSLAVAIACPLIPLANSTSSAVALDPLNCFLIFLGVVSTLAYFQYLARRKPNGQVERRLLARAVGVVGQGFVVITLGALY